MLIDFRHKPTENDLLMYNYLKYYNVPVTVIATKYDKVKPSLKDKQMKIITEIMDIAMGDNLVFFSSVTKKGREEVYKIISEEY